MNVKTIILAVATCLVLASVCVALSDESSAATHRVGTYEELDQAILDAEDGDTITLLEDIVLDPEYSDPSDNLEPIMTISSDVTLDLNGHSILWDTTKTGSSIPYTLCIFSIDGCNVTFTGNGTVDAEAGYNNSYGINIIKGGELTIENGQYYGATTAIQVNQGSLYVHGGVFDLAKTIKEAAPQYDKYIINAIDPNWGDGSASIKLMGGTYGYDYENLTETVGSSYIVEGYGTIDNGDGTYTIGTVGDGNSISSDSPNASVDSDNNAVIVKVEGEVSDATVSATVTTSGDSKVSMVYNGDLNTNGLSMSATEVSEEDIPEEVDRNNILKVFDLNVNRGDDITTTFNLSVTISVDIPEGMVLSNAWVVYYGDGITERYDATINGSEITFSTNHTSPYVFYGEYEADASGSGTGSWDDDEDLPPFIPTQPAEDDDTVTIVACAAAAAVAAIMAVFLIIDRKG